MKNFLLSLLVIKLMFYIDTFLKNLILILSCLKKMIENKLFTILVEKNKFYLNKIFMIFFF